jgi:hypothetical protein
VVTSSLAHADEVRDACDQVARVMGAFKGGLHRQYAETFEDDGKIYRGCLVTIVGDRRRVPGRTPPADRAYPKPGSTFSRAGWKADREADGPDGTSYRITRGDVFCVVNGAWDGGVTSDPKETRSPLFLITAQCAKVQ